MSNLIEQDAQELADDLGFDLKKLPYGFQFRIGKLILNYYNTTSTVVISKPKQGQKVKKNIAFNKLKPMLKKLKSEIDVGKPITGEQAISFVLSGVEIKHKRIGESEWRRDDVRKLPLDSFLNKTFVFELGVTKWVI